MVRREGTAEEVARAADEADEQQQEWVVEQPLHKWNSLKRSGSAFRLGLFSH